MVAVNRQKNPEIPDDAKPNTPGERNGQIEHADLWRAFKEKGDRKAREELILLYAPLVKYIAGRVAIGLPPTVEYDDLISYGIFGLIDAVEKFDPNRGVKFETYAISRIRGAVIDGLRAVDWVPRSVRQKAREFEAVCQRVESELGRSASDEELSQAMNLALDDYQQMLAEVSCTTLTSLDELWKADGNVEENIRVMETIADASSVDPVASVEFEEMKRILAEAIDRLSERERLVIALYYYEGLTLKEIGKVLEVTEARVSQIHSKAILRLRGRLSRFKQSLQG